MNKIGIIGGVIVAVIIGKLNPEAISSSNPDVNVKITDSIFSPPLSNSNVRKVRTFSASVKGNEP